MSENLMNNLLWGSNVKLYIDPATTSYVIQIVTGIIIALGTAFGIFWSKIRRRFKKKIDVAEQPVSNKEKKGQGGVIKAEDLMSDDDDKEK